MRWLVLLASLAVPAVGQADIVHLRGGIRHYGRLVSQSAETVRFRVAIDRQGRTILRSFPAEHVLRIQECDLAVPPMIEPQSPLGPAQWGLREYDQVVREGFELLDDDELRGALRAWQRAVSAAAPEHLAQLDALTRDRRGLPLDELMALTRIRLAADDGAGRTFRIKYATRFERGALGRILVHYQDQLLSQQYEGRSVSEWTTNAHEYAELSAATPHLFADATRAAAVIATRLRLDPQLDERAAERRRLHQRRSQLIDLARRLMRLPGYPAQSGKTELRDSAAELVADWVASNMNHDVAKSSDASVSEVTDVSQSSSPTSPGAE